MSTYWNRSPSVLLSSKIHNSSKFFAPTHPLFTAELIRKQCAWRIHCWLISSSILKAYNIISNTIIQDIEIFPPSVFVPPLSTLKLIWKQPPWWVHHWDRNPEWGYWRFHPPFIERNHHRCLNHPAHQNSQSNNISQESKPNVQLSTSFHNSKSTGEQPWNTTSRFFKTNF